MKVNVIVTFKLSLQDFFNQEQNTMSSIYMDLVYNFETQLTWFRFSTHQTRQRKVPQVGSSRQCILYLKGFCNEADQAHKLMKQTTYSAIACYCTIISTRVHHCAISPHLLCCLLHNQHSAFLVLSKTPTGNSLEPE